MVREIVKDSAILTKISERADRKQDAAVVRDLLDTAKAHEDRCVGLAAIQIGEPRRIIVVKSAMGFITMINPFILNRSRSTFDTEEGCMSVDGLRPVRRHNWITLGYETTYGRKVTTQFDGLSAQIIQHEVDHLNGILI